MYSESGLTTAAQTALANKYMDAYSFVTANASNPVVTALKPVLRQTHSYRQQALPI